MAEWFKDWFNSPYYHILYCHRSDEEALKLVQNLYAYLHPSPGDTLLDLACGKGRHAKAFADLGLDVTGMDLSPASIEAAKINESDTLHFFVHDMRKPSRTNYFDFVCNLFTSFGYFRTAHDHVLAAQSMMSALKPGGRLIIDFVNREPARRHNLAHADEKIEREQLHFQIHRHYTDTHLIKSIEVRDADQTYTFEEKVRSFTREELRDIFTSTGLQELTCFGNYDLGPYDPASSPRMILVFQKPL